MTTEWTEEDSDNAIKEGWNLYDTEGSNGGILQVQRNDEDDILDDDIEAWKLVANGNDAHHIKAKEILKIENYMEYERIVNSIL